MSRAARSRPVSEGDGLRSGLTTADERVAVGSDGPVNRADQGSQPDLMSEALRRWVSEGGSLRRAD